MSWLRSGWDSLWFDAAPASQLAVVRILVGCFSFWFLWERYLAFQLTAATPPELFMPVGPIWALHAEDGLPLLLRGIGFESLADSLVGPVGLERFRLLLNATLVFNLLFVVGFQFRISGPVFAVLLLWLLSYRNSWTMIYHTSNLVVLQVFILGITASANALSLDSLWRGRFGPGPWLRGMWKPTDSAVDWRYGWPLRLIIAVTTATYFLAGMAKVAGPLGWSWASGESLLTYIHHDGIRKELLGGAATTATHHLHELTALLTLVAILTLVIELGAPLVLLGRRGSRYRIWAPAIWAFVALCMHWGILFIMGIEFRYQRSGIAFAAFLPLGLFLGRNVNPPPGSPEGR